MDKYNLIFLSTDKMLLSKKQYSNWMEIQDDYDDYVASVNFDSLEGVLDYIVLDYDLSPERAKEEIGKLQTTSGEQVEIII